MKKWIFFGWCIFVPVLAVVSMLLLGTRFFSDGYYDAIAARSVLHIEEGDVVEPEPTHVIAPPDAVDILADGEIICTVVNDEVASSVLQELLLLHAAAPAAGERLVEVRFVKEITSAPAFSGESVLDFEEALAFLDDASVCPVERVVEEITFTGIDHSIDTAPSTHEDGDENNEDGEADESDDDEEGENGEQAPGVDELIPVGSRIVESMGQNGLNRQAVTVTYLNGVEQRRSEPSMSHSYDPITLKITDGAYISDDPEDEPGKDEGATGKELSFALVHPCEDDDIESNFGTRENEMHYGIDYGAKAGDEVFAPATGIVVYAGERNGYGGVVEIDCGEDVRVRLAWISSISVKLGDIVSAGSPIGVVMQEQDGYQSKLHLEVLIDGIPYNPRQYFE